MWSRRWPTCWATSAARRGCAGTPRPAPASPGALLFLSTGELGLAARLAEGGKRAMAGQAVRVVEIPADAGAGLRHLRRAADGFAGGAELAEHLRLAADRQCGHAGRVFLERLTRALGRVSRPGPHRPARQFTAEQCPHGRRRPGQAGVRPLRAGRGGGRAGDLAGRAALAAGRGRERRRPVLRGLARPSRRHGAGGDRRPGMRQVRLFLEQHGSSRFETGMAHRGPSPRRPARRPRLRSAGPSTGLGSGAPTTRATGPTTCCRSAGRPRSARASMPG